MKIDLVFSKDILAQNPNPDLLELCSSSINWIKRESKITDAQGNIIFHMPEVTVPDFWSQTATDILAQKYFRKTGVPEFTVRKITPAAPTWLLPSLPVDGTTFGGETSAHQVFHRMAGAWTYWGWTTGYFDDKNAINFYSEIYYMLAHQMAAPNSPQWFNTGLHWAYGIAGEDAGLWYINPDNNQPERIHNSYERPQVHACFIQPVKDSLVSEGGIFDLVKNEARLFKYGSGSGTNFSSLRAKGQALSGGGSSSGVMSFLKIFDAAAGAIKSGGTTRRAAKLVCLDINHPEIKDFINWKSNEELKARKLIQSGYSVQEAIESISGQNSNNSVRVTDDFLFNVTYEDPKSLELWNDLCVAAYHCGDPGVQFDDTINSWNTCSNSARINATNPCSEFHFLDNTACNLASINLGCFYEPYMGFRVDSFIHACKVWTIVLDISNSMAGFPTKEIAEGTNNYRTIGLGYADLGAVIMRQGWAYDSYRGGDFAASITSLMTGVAYKTSQILAKELGGFPQYEFNSEPMRKIIKKHCNHLESPCDFIWKSARAIWRDIFKNTIHFRNAQVTVLAPTGTIALLMDCDTTGIEPAFALKTQKKLEGGGTITAVNKSIYGALFALGYDSHQATNITKAIENNIEIKNIPELKPEHYNVFATAVGDNVISPEAHVKMVASVQPFLSGGVSKTVNLPNNATASDISKIYLLAFNLGLKSISVYRDGCKVYQPLTGIERAISNSPPQLSDVGDGTEDPDENGELTEENIESFYNIYNTLNSSDSDMPDFLIRGERKSLPTRRSGYTQKLTVNNQDIYLRTGDYEDGKLGEIFCNLAKVGSATRGIMEAFCIAVSMGLQYGVPLQKFVNAFVHMRFEPNGLVQGHNEVKMCASVVDLIFRELGWSYLKDESLVHNIPERSEGGAVVEVAEVIVEVIDTTNTSNALSAVNDICWECGQNTLISTGTCQTCTTCGANSGCN
jgi:ribonucleoside-diphosphate reductase alpha chain